MLQQAAAVLHTSVCTRRHTLTIRVRFHCVPLRFSAIFSAWRVRRDLPSRRMIRATAAPPPPQHSVLHTLHTGGTGQQVFCVHIAVHGCIGTYTIYYIASTDQGRSNSLLVDQASLSEKSKTKSCINWFGPYLHILTYTWSFSGQAIHRKWQNIPCNFN